MAEFCDAKYETIYVKGGATKEVLKTGGSSNWRRLNWKLKSFMIRRERSQVLADLPDKHRQIVELDLNLTAYHKYASAAYKNHKDNPDNKFFSMANFSGLRIKAADLKLDHCCETAEQVVDSDGSVVIFYHHYEVFLLQNELR